MANNTPLSGATQAAGGYLIPDAAGKVLANGLLQESGAFALAGDAQSTSSRKEIFPVWNGAPTAEFVGEGGTKPVTGAEFGAGTITVKKIAAIVTFTDEMLEDVQSGDLNVLVDSGIRAAIADLADANAVGKDSGTDISTNFDNALSGTTQFVEVDQSKQDGLALAVSAAMGSLEANGYGADIGVLAAANIGRHLRDARITGVSGGGTASATVTALSQGLYQPVNDPFYGKPTFVSSNLNNLGSSGGTNDVVGYVVARPNIHVRVRHDVRVARSNEASVGGTSLWQNDLTGLRFVYRVGYYIHDINRAVVELRNAA